MSSQADYQAMEGDRPRESKCTQCRKWTLKIVCGVLALYLVVVICVQAVLYNWATWNCSPGMLKGYNFPGGGETDLVPNFSLITEQAPKWWGKSFVNTPADKEGLGVGASTGIYFRTWGPLFWTYSYQDTMSKVTFIIRDRPLNLGGSHQITRCDGQGPKYIVTEGTHVLMNWIRSLFGMYASRMYNIYADGKLVAVSQKLGGTGQSHKQIIFRKPDEDSPFASCYLKDRNFHGRFDEWFVQVDAGAPVPNFVPTAMAALMGFRTADYKNQSSEASMIALPQDPASAPGADSEALAAEPEPLLRGTELRSKAKVATEAVAGTNQAAATAAVEPEATISEAASTPAPKVEPVASVQANTVEAETTIGEARVPAEAASDEPSPKVTEQFA